MGRIETSTERLRRCLLGLRLAAASALIACGAEPVTVTAEPLADLQPEDVAQEKPARDFAPFDAQIRRRLATEPGLRGAVALVMHAQHGIVHQQAYGAFTLERTFLLGTSSALLSTGVAMRLVDQGLLSLDDTLAQLLPQWGMHKQRVTVAQLLSGSAGLPSLESVRDADFAPLEAPAPLLTAHLCQRRARGSLSACGQAVYQDDDPRTNASPDARFAFGGSQLQLVGAIAEQVSGRSWEALLEETYRAPCGIRSLGYTNLLSAQQPEAPFAYPLGFSGTPSKLTPTDNPSIDSGAYITGPDFAQILLMHLRGGRCGETEVLSERAVMRMRDNRIARVYSGVTGSPAASGYGLGWFVNEQTGTISAPGSHGAYPLIDLKRGYGVLLLLEEEYIMGMQLLLDVKPSLDAMFPAR
jgi:CubicO group peptidase (beta-lactamase class C family)